MAARRAPAKALPEGAEERLLVQAAQRDPVKFGDLYELHFSRIYAFISRRVRERHRVEDLTSEVFHKALSNLKNYEWRGAPFGAWLIRIALNAVIDHAKRTARETLTHDPPDRSSKSEQQEIELRASLFDLVERLPTDQRHVVFQRFVEQKSIREIAQQLGRSEGAVKQLQFRALERLRSEWGARG
jgi:RNA polymerase sigma-70 factor, ECF subfamily